MPADFLLLNLVNMIRASLQELQAWLDQDPFLQAMKNHLMHQDTPSDPQMQNFIQDHAENSFLEHVLL